MSNQIPPPDSLLVRRAKAGVVAVAAVGGGVIVGSLVMGAMQQGTATADTQHVTSAVANDQQLAPPQVPDQGGLSAPQAPPQAVPVDHPSPVPSDASSVRYNQGYNRQFVGGCGMYDKDMKYANTLALATINTTVLRALEAAKLPNAHFLDLSNAYLGNRLCEKGVDLVGVGRPVKKWTNPNALAGSEWVTAIRVESLIVDGPYDIGESLHPNYWGGLTNQACLKLVYNGGNVRGGSCIRAEGIYPNLDGDNRTYPMMTLVDVNGAPTADARPTRSLR